MAFRTALRLTPLLAIAMAAGCTSTPRPGPIDVTRFHLGQPIPPGPISVEPMATNASISPEYQTYADAVQAQLTAMGFTAAPGAASTYIAAVSFTRTSRGYVRKRPPVTIGLGGGSYGGNVGVGGGASFGIGGGRAELVDSELQVQLRRRSDNSVIWEGRAVTEGLLSAESNQPGETAGRLARAVFKGFPGESGITITVK